LVDDDVLDTPSNLRRMQGTRNLHLRATTPHRKVDLLADHLDGIGLGAPVERIYGDVRSEDVFQQLLDYDVVVCATDTHGSRAVLNDPPYSYLLPVIDVGVRAGSNRKDQLASLAAEVRVLLPHTPCLWCRG